MVFAEVQEGNAVRLFILQFEGFNDGVDDQYRYDLSSSPEVAGYRWRSNAYTFNIASSAANNPGGESAATAAKLNANIPVSSREFVFILYSTSCCVENESIIHDVCRLLFFANSPAARTADAGRYFNSFIVR